MQSNSEAGNSSQTPSCKRSQPRMYPTTLADPLHTLAAQGPSEGEEERGSVARTRINSGEVYTVPLDSKSSNLQPAAVRLARWGAAIRPSQSTPGERRSGANWERSRAYRSDIVSPAPDPAGHRAPSRFTPLAPLGAGGASEPTLVGSRSPSPPGSSSLTDLDETLADSSGAQVIAIPLYTSLSLAPTAKQ
jgi:hypothetical protein